MKWIEVIEVRLFEQDRKSITSQLLQLKEDVEKEAGNQKVDVYSRFGLNSDFAIHLVHETKDISLNGSDLAMKLSTVLGEFGQVNHKIWIELAKES